MLKKSGLSFDAAAVDALSQVRFQFQPKSMRKSRTLGRAGSLRTTVEMVRALTQVRVHFFTHRRQSSNVGVSKSACWQGRQQIRNRREGKQQKEGGTPN